MACCRSVLASLVLACVVGWDQASGTTFQYNRQRGAWERIISQQQSGKNTATKSSDNTVALIKSSSQPSVITKRLVTHLDSGGAVRVLHSGWDSSLPAGEGTDVFHSSIDTEAAAERQLQELIDTGRNEHISAKRAFELALVYQQRHDEMFTTGLYRAILYADPTHFAAYFNLGTHMGSGIDSASAQRMRALFAQPCRHAAPPGTSQFESVKLHSVTLPHCTPAHLQAQGLLETATALKPNHILAQLNLFELYARAGDLKNAEKTLRRPVFLAGFVAITPNGDLVGTNTDDTILHLRVTIGAAILLHKKAKLQQAAVEYRRVLLMSRAFDPTLIPLPAVHINFGTLHQQLGQRKESLESYLKALKMMPQLDNFVEMTLRKTPIEARKILWPLWDQVMVDADHEALVSFATR